MVQYISLVFYMISLAFAVSATHTFIVVDTGAILIALAALIGPAIFAFQNWNKRPYLVIGLAHIIIAVILHPEMSYRSSVFAFSNVLVENVKEFTVSGDNWWVMADKANEISVLSQQIILFDLKTNHPAFYWASPLSMTLFFFGALIIALGARNKELCAAGRSEPRETW